jgi:hypothetical protein
MLNLQALNTVRSQTAETERLRTEKTEQLFAKALAIFEAFIQNPSFEQFQAIQPLLLETIRLKRNQPKPYIMISYLFLLYGETQQALKYFKVAATLAPQSPEVQRMMVLIENAAKAVVPVAASVAGSRGGAEFGFVQPQNDDDFDELYEETEALILVELKKVMHISLALSPDFAQEKKRLEVHELRYLALQSSLFARLRLLDQELDISELKLKAQPLERFLGRIHGCLGQLSALLETEGRLKLLIDEVQAKKQYLSASDQGNALWLEGVYDSCDQLADSLDAYEAQHLPIQSLLEHYATLTAGVEALQDLLDEGAN